MKIWVGLTFKIEALNMFPDVQRLIKKLFSELSRDLDEPISSDSTNWVTQQESLDNPKIAVYYFVRQSHVDVVNKMTGNSVTLNNDKEDKSRTQYANRQAEQYV